MPAARTASATPATSGASGPTTTRFAPTSTASAATAAPSSASTACRVARCGDARIAGGGVHGDDRGVRGQGQRQGVLAPAGTDQQDAQRLVNHVRRHYRPGPTGKVSAHARSRLSGAAHPTRRAAGSTIPTASAGSTGRTTCSSSTTRTSRCTATSAGATSPPPTCCAGPSSRSLCAPRPGRIDGAGCWSGCIVDDAGTPTAVYTAVPDHADERRRGAGPQRPDADRLDRRTSTRWSRRRPIRRSTRPGTRSSSPSRATGTRSRAPARRFGRPQLVLYGCDDLEHWTELGPLLTDDDPVAAQVAAANIWECPNLALIDGRWVLLISLWRWVDDVHELAGVRYLIGDLVARRRRSALRGQHRRAWSTKARRSTRPQLISADDRTLLWGWSWETRPQRPSIEAAGWAGALTFPRELVGPATASCSREPAAELTGLRRRRSTMPPAGPRHRAGLRDRRRRAGDRSACATATRRRWSSPPARRRTRPGSWSTAAWSSCSPPASCTPPGPTRRRPAPG